MKNIPTTKQFATWNNLKIKIDSSKLSIFGYKERDIWWTSIGHNIGNEEDGKGILFNRPVLILKGFNRYQFWGIPLSTTEKQGIYYYKFLCNNKISTALLSQMRSYDTKRLISKFGMISTKDFMIIKQKIKKIID